MNDQARRVLVDAGVDVSTERILAGGILFTDVPGGREAVDLWKRLTPALEAIGCWPLICGNAQEFDRIEEQLTLSPKSPAGLLSEVPSEPPLRAMATAKKERYEKLVDRLRSLGKVDLIHIMQQAEEQHEQQSPDYKSWTGQNPSWDDRIVSAYGYGETPPKKVLLAIIPSAQSTLR